MHVVANFLGSSHWVFRYFPAIAICAMSMHQSSLRAESLPLDKLLDDAAEVGKGVLGLTGEVFDEVQKRMQKATAKTQNKDFLTAEEAGYLEYFFPVHMKVKDCASTIIIGESGERKAAWEELKKTGIEWKARIAETMPPESMMTKGLNLREELLKLWEASEKSKNAEAVTDACVRYLRTRADYNDSLKKRPSTGQASAPKKSKTRFSFRPFGNPFLIYTGDGSFEDGKFKGSLFIPTPLGGVTVWQEEAQSHLKYLIVEYNNMRRFLRLDSDVEFVVEDENMYAVSVRTEGDSLVMRISTKTKEGEKPKSKPTAASFR